MAEDRIDDIDRIVVVVPARDEEETVEAALAAIRVAQTQVAPRTVEIVVVADGCSDRTAARASDAGVHVVISEAACVGAARARGVEQALVGCGNLDRVWIASTDADSVVPPGWLRSQVEAAEAGSDVVLGTVTLDPADAERHVEWVSRYQSFDPAAGHRHVHGASLGVRASVYVRLGGFSALDVHEDVDLVTRALASGARAAWVDDAPVRTSARHGGRVVGGVGSDLAASARDRGASPVSA